MESRGAFGSVERIRDLRDALDDVIETHQRFEGALRRVGGARRAVEAYREAVGPDGRGDDLVVTLQREVERVEQQLGDLESQHRRARRRAERQADQVEWDSLRAPSRPTSQQPLLDASEMADERRSTNQDHGSTQTSAELPSFLEGRAADSAGERQAPSEDVAGGEAGTASLWAEILREEADDAGFCGEAGPEP